MVDLPDILSEIVSHKAVEVETARDREPLEELKRRCRDLALVGGRDLTSALRRSGGDDGGGGLRVLAEIKHKSPSAGLIRPGFDPAALARMLEAAGADALSVLTDERYFGGRLEYIGQARGSCNLPILRKDFIIDHYQIWEARAAGADGFLLIAEVLPSDRLAELVALGRELGLAALVECHAEEGLERALESGATLVGINNRDLRTFRVSLETTARLAGRVPGDRVLVSESGIATKSDAAFVRGCGAQAVLVGESVMKASSASALIGEFKQAR